MTLYDRIGNGYAMSRPADHRIVNALSDALALKSGSSVLDVGAGTGKYARAMAERGLNVLAIEPSEVMRQQSAPHPGVRMLSASAESIPLPSNSADGAFIVLALHHFRDREAALTEIIRVIGTGPLVIFSFEPHSFGKFWLADYFPNLGREIKSSFSELSSVASEISCLTGRTVRTIPFPLPNDLEDRFGAAGWARPESYLDPVIRNGISSFALMSPDTVRMGLERLESDLASGRWDARYGALRPQSHLDVGYRFYVAEVEMPPCESK